MHLLYSVIMIMLFLILMLLWKEEARFRKNITHGMASKFWILRERRNYVRFNDEIKVRDSLKNKSPNFVHSKTTNISRRGVCLLTYERLKEKGCVEMEMEVPRFSKPVKLIGQVVWTKNLQTQDEQGRRLFYVGIRFSKINPESEAILLTHLNTAKAGLA